MSIKLEFTHEEANALRLIIGIVSKEYVGKKPEELKAGAALKKLYDGLNAKAYSAPEIEIAKALITLDLKWIARDADGDLFAYSNEPTWDDWYEGWQPEEGHCFRLAQEGIFQNVTETLSLLEVVE